MTRSLHPGLEEGGSEQSFITLAVKDTGIGVPDDIRDKIFDPFFTTKPVGKGTGLGLSLSYGIVKKHGGRLEVESEPGCGARFRMTIPVHRSEGAAA